MWDMNSINEESRVDFNRSPVLWRCCWRFALTNAKGSFESGKFSLKITCESVKLFNTGCRVPPKSSNFGTLYTFFRSILETVHVVWKKAVNFRQYGIVHPYSKVSQVIRISEDVTEYSAFNFGESAHRFRRMKRQFRQSAALRQTFQIRHNAKRITMDFKPSVSVLFGHYSLPRRRILTKLRRT